LKLVCALLYAPLLTALLCGGGTAQAQGDPSESTPVALKGYDVVAYFKEHRPAKGLPEFRQDFDGVRYYFSTGQNRETFRTDPDHFTPQFGGYCAMGMSDGKKFEADPTLFKIVDGKLYVFSSPKGPGAVDRDPQMLVRARQAWDALK
jgi:YHS domain-containing protein